MTGPGGGTGSIRERIPRPALGIQPCEEAGYVCGTPLDRRAPALRSAWSSAFHRCAGSSDPLVQGTSCGMFPARRVGAFCPRRTLLKPSSDVHAWKGPNHYAYHTLPESSRRGTDDLCILRGRAACCVLREAAIREEWLIPNPCREGERIVPGPFRCRRHDVTFPRTGGSLIINVSADSSGPCSKSKTHGIKPCVLRIPARSGRAAHSSRTRRTARAYICGGMDRVMIPE